LYFDETAIEMDLMANSMSIGIQDLTAALALLRPSDENEAQRIASALGFQLELRYQDSPQSKPPQANQAISPTTSPSKSRSEPEPTGSNENLIPEQAIGQQSRSWSPLIAGLIAIGESESALSNEPLELRQIVRSSSKPSKETLFQTAWFPEIVREMLAMEQNSDGIDYEKMIYQISAGEPLETILYEKRATLLLGVDVYLDFSESMQPFWEDLQLLVDALGQVMGPFAVNTYPFQIRKWAENDERVLWLDMEPKNSGATRPVLIVTDFGLWSSMFGPCMVPDPSLLSHIRQCRNNGRAVIGLMPVSSRDVPREVLLALDRCVEWDRTTSPSFVATGRLP
jgi:hypothetical protein